QAADDGADPEGGPERAEKSGRAAYLLGDVDWEGNLDGPVQEKEDAGNREQAGESAVAGDGSAPAGCHAGWRWDRLYKICLALGRRWRGFVREGPVAGQSPDLEGRR